MASYYSSNKTPIQIGEEINRGGEGIIYDLGNNQVAKIFFEPKERVAKLEAIIRKNLSIPNVCLPQELIYDGNNVIGYIMPKIGGHSMQTTIFQPQLFKAKFADWTRVELTKLAIDILEKIQILHNNNILLGDINPYNINIVNYNKVFFLDTDSYQVDDYKCLVGTVDFSAPEIIGKDFSTFLRTKEHEYFAIATLLFKIYLPGKHPYSRSGGGELKENIINHEFAFPLGDADGLVNAVPKGQWEAIWYDLPYELRKYFFDVFKSQIRHSPKEWISLLQKYLQDLESNKYSRIVFPNYVDFITTNKTLNMNRRDITDKDTSLREIETKLSSIYPPKKIAVLELSTKAVKLLIGPQVKDLNTEKFDFKLFDRQAQKTNTGRYLDSKNIMDLEGYKVNVLPYIIKFKQYAVSKGVDCLYTVATAAYRTANNREDIVALISRKAGINVKILKKQEEALTTINAFRFSTSHKEILNQHKYSMIIDQGGGSTEVSIFEKENPILTYSINLGTEVLRTLVFKESTASTTLRQAFAQADSMIKDRLETFYKNNINNFPSNPDIYCVGVGSAITNATGKQGNAKQHDTVLSKQKLAERINTIDSQLKSSFEYVSDLYCAVEKNDKLDGVLVQRLGLPMIIYLMDKLHFDQLTVSGTGLWYGVYFQQLFNLK